MSIDPKAFLHALLQPLGTWTAMVVGATLSGHPGVACMTPMAWLLGLWAGVLYVGKAGGRSSLLGPVLAGLLLGLGIGGLFVYSNRLMMASEVRPDEIAKARMLTMFMFAGSVVTCPALSALTAAIMRRRLAGGR